jgi:hypothetical protein
MIYPILSASFALIFNQVAMGNGRASMLYLSYQLRKLMNLEQLLSTSSTLASRIMKFYHCCKQRCFFDYARSHQAIRLITVLSMLMLCCARQLRSVLCTLGLQRHNLLSRAERAESVEHRVVNLASVVALVLGYHRISSVVDSSVIFACS